MANFYTLCSQTIVQQLQIWVITKTLLTDNLHSGQRISQFEITKDIRLQPQSISFFTVFTYQK